MDPLEKAYAELKAAIEYGVKRSKGRKYTKREYAPAKKYKVVPRGDMSEWGR
jgi:hypothetical protein